MRAVLGNMAAWLVVLVFAAGCVATVELPAAADRPAAVRPTVAAVEPVHAGEPATNAAEPDSAGAPPATPTPAAPQPSFAVGDDWPPVLREYVDFVQTTRGEEFETASTVRFAEAAAIIAEFQLGFVSFDDLLPADQAVILRLDDMYRALGLTNDEFNLLEANSAVLTDVAAFYDWQADEIVFPSPDGQPVDAINIIDRPVLVHELGHALQAKERLEWTERLPDQALALALLEGEAEWLFDQYLWSLSAEEYDEWNNALPEGQPSGQAEILEVEFGVSYALGGRFFHARFAQNGLAGIDSVFHGVDRMTSQLLLDPWRFTGREIRQESFAFETPEVPAGAEPIDLTWDFPTSAVSWHQILGAALPGPEALAAARSINSFTVPAGWIDPDGRLCFAIWTSASLGTEAVVEQALTAWAAVPGVDRWVQPVERGFEVGGCDPGPGNVPTPRATPYEVLGEVLVVIDTETWVVERGLPASDGFCVGWDLLAAFEADPLINTYSWLDDLDLTALPATC